MTSTYVIEYSDGPASRVGPFSDRESADSWADRYWREYRKKGGKGLIAWHISPIVNPESLEWW